MTKFFRIDGEYNIHDVKAFQTLEGQPVISTVRLAEIVGLDVDNVNRVVINAYEAALKLNPSLQYEIMNEIFYHDKPGVKYLKKALVLGWGPFTTYVRTFGMRPQEVLKNVWNEMHDDTSNEKCENVEDVESVKSVEIVEINEEPSEIAITSLQIAEHTGKRHDHVMRDIKKMLEELGLGLPKFGGTYISSQNKELPMYILPEREALILASGYSTKLRASIIDELARLKKESVSQVQLPDFSDPVLMARTWADQEERNQKNQKLLISKDEELEVAISLAKEAGESSVREFVKELSIDRFGLKACFVWLRERGYIMKNGEPYQKWVNKGYFTMKPWKEDKNEVAHFQPMLTELGRRKIAKIIRKEFEELNDKGSKDGK